MTEISSTPEVLDFADGERDVLPSGLNILTILTFIGSAIALLSGVWTYSNAEKSYKGLVDAQDKIASAPAYVKGMMGPEMVEMSKKSMENKLPIMLLTLVGAALCIYGAIEMRKLKKQGYILWVVGEIVPIIAGLLFIGAGMFSGFALIAMVFPVIFIILDSVQKKYLVH